MQKAFLEKAKASGADIVVLDIPLLFENRRGCARRRHSGGHRSGGGPARPVWRAG